MMFRRLACVCTVVFTLIVPAFADETRDKLENFRAFLEEYRKERRIVSLSVAVVRDGRILFAEGFGWQDHDAEEPATAQTSYLAASITKTFTAATLLQMDQDGHIDLDADFTKLERWARLCDWMTRSGNIFGGATLDDGTVIEELDCKGPISLRQVLSHRVNGVPGTSFLYNPIVFGRLSDYVEQETGRPFRDWMYQYVVGRGELKDVAAGWRDPQKGHVLTNLAPPFKHVDRNGEPGVAPSILPNTELNASSGVIASVIGLANYSIALDRNKILSPSLKATMWTPPKRADGTPPPYAYGWYVQDWQGHRLVWHTGWWPDAYAGILLKAPDDGWALIALGNTDGIRWGNPLDKAEVEKSKLAAKFLDLFVKGDNR